MTESIRMLTDARSGLSAGQQLSVNSDGTTRRSHDNWRLIAVARTCDRLDHIERSKAGMLKKSVPGQYIRTPDISGLQDAEPMACCLLAKMMHEDRLDLIAPVEQQRRIVVGRQGGAID